MNAEIDQVVRVVGWRGTYRVKTITPQGWVTVWGGTALHFGMRTVEAHKIKPSRKGDVVPGYPRGFLKPTRKAAR